MTEREQVIANLLYMKRDCLEGSGNDKTIDRAVKLLKEQEPRVLTLDEAMGTDVCWLEKKGDDRVWPCEIGGGEKWVAVWRFDQETTVMRRDEYGKKFRCWSARPTVAQREETPWQ